MKVLCEQGHEVCTVPDGIGWELSEKNFTDWDAQQTTLVNGESIVSIEQIRWQLTPLRKELGMETHLAGRCWCGAPHAGLDANGFYRVHTAEGWTPNDKYLLFSVLDR